MKTIRYIENGVDSEGQLLREPVAVRSTQGLSLFNANGDVSDASTGFKYAIDTMSFIKSEITRQKYYEIPFADYMPVSVGRGGFAEDIFTNLSFSNGGSFASGIIQTGANTRIAGVDASVAKKSQAARLWAKQITYSVPEIEQALQANNWDPIMAKEEARKKNFDLGLQETSFLGLTGDTAVLGLLNQADVTIDLTTITATIASKNAADFAALIAALISGYYTATNSTAMPTDFVMPASDYIACGGIMVPNVIGAGEGNYPITKLEYLRRVFREQTQNQGFQIRPLVYAEAARNTAAGINKQCYSLYRQDPSSLGMEIPVQYTTTAANTLNNFTFQNVGYGRFTGLAVFRNLEMIYYRF